MSEKIRILRPERVEQINENYDKIYDEWWYDQYGYDRDGWDRRWFNIYGIHRVTQDYFNEQGLDERWFDRNGVYCREEFGGEKKTNLYWFPWDMICEFNSIGIHKVTRTPFNECGLNWKGIDKQGNAVITKKYHNLKTKFDSLCKEIEHLNQERDKLIDFKNIQISKKREEVIRNRREHQEKLESKLKELEDQIKNIEKELKSMPSAFAIKKPEWKNKLELSNNLKKERDSIRSKISEDEIFIEEILLNGGKNLNHNIWEVDIKIWNIEKRLDDKKDKLKELEKDMAEEESKRSVFEVFFNN